MRDQQHGQAAPPRQIADQLHDGSLVADVEIRQGLVHQQKTRTADERLGEEQPLLLASRDTAQRVIRVSGGADGLDRCRGRGRGLRPASKADAPAPSVHAQLDKVAASDRQLGVKARSLRDVADGRIAAAWRPAEDLDAAAGRREKAQDHANQRGLARAVRTKDGRERPRLDVKRGIGPDPPSRVARGEVARRDRHAARQPVDFNATSSSWSCFSCQSWKDTLSG